jgi:hypothetical protein
VGGVLTKQGKNMSYTTAAKTLKKVADNITNTTLERQVAQESIFKSCSSIGMVEITVGLYVTGPLKVNGKVWNVNLRTINEEGVESLIKMFCAEGYSEFAPGMLGVVEVSGQSQYRERKVCYVYEQGSGLGLLIFSLLSLFINGYLIVKRVAKLRYVSSMK